MRWYRRRSWRSAAAVEAEFPELPGEWCERVADLRERGGDLDGAFRLLVEAGRRALRRGALLTAEETLDRARRIAGRDRWRRMGVDRILARVLASTGNIVRLQELAVGTLEIMAGKHDSMGTPSRLGELQLQIARGFVAAGDWAGADQQLRVVEDLAQAADDHSLRCSAQALLATVAFELGDRRRATELASAAEANATASTAKEATGTAHRVRARLALVAGDVEGAVALLRRAEQLAAADPGLILDHVETLVTLAVVDEATTATLEHVVRAADLAAATEAPQTQVLVEVQRARLHLARFELDAARTAADRAVDVSRRYALPTLADALATRAELAALEGAGQLARELLRQIPSSSAARRPAHRAVNATLALCAADFARVRRSLDDLPPGDSTEDAATYAWWGGLNLLLSAVAGSPPLAAPDSSRSPATVAAAFRKLATAVLKDPTDPEASDETFARADAFLEPFPWRRQIARLIVADVRSATGWPHASSSMDEAAAFFERAGQARLSAACRGVLRRAGIAVGRRGRGSAPVPPLLEQAGITSREMDVLLLVGDGMSNAEIAQRLYLSVRTVESHVSSALRRTGAPNRAALTALVVEAQADH